MTIQLGNLEMKDIVNEEHLEKIQNFLEQNGYQREVRCDDIGKVKGNYHIFDIPRIFTICGEDKMQEFISFLKENNLVSSGFKERVGLTYEVYNN